MISFTDLLKELDKLPPEIDRIKEGKDFFSFISQFSLKIINSKSLKECQIIYKQIQSETKSFIEQQNSALPPVIKEISKSIYNSSLQALERFNYLNFCKKLDQSYNASKIQSFP